MKFYSTKDSDIQLKFEQLLVSTLDKKGGLFIPAEFPDISSKFDWLSRCTYQQVVFFILQLFSDNYYPEQQLKSIIRKGYASFYHPQILASRDFGNISLVELFHGPSRSFKDLALQILGGLLESHSIKHNQQYLILGATSGDTGSAALQAFSSKQGLKIIMLHPHNLVSQLQKLQMTTIISPNVANIAIRGSFDDCQNLIKTIFKNQSTFPDITFSAVNSINLLRIILQIAYYIYIYVQNNQKSLNIVVPSGNFGNALAGWYAKKMGVAINKIVIATNHNNILERAINTGIYQPQEVKASIAPAMDIQIASNWERLLFEVSGRDYHLCNLYYKNLENNGCYTIDPNILAKIRADFMAVAVSQKQIQTTINNFYNKHKYYLDPHTAIGVFAAEQLQKNSQLDNCTCLATAHPAKFYEVFEQLGIPLSLPEDLEQLFDKESRQLVFEPDEQILTEFIYDFAK